MYFWLKVFAILLEEEGEGIITNPYPSKSQDGERIRHSFLAL